MKNNPANAVLNVIRNRPAIHLKYDSSVALYAKREDELPVHQKDVKGNVKLDIVTFIVAFASARALLSCLCAFLKHKKKKAAKKNKTE